MMVMVVAMMVVMVVVIVTVLLAVMMVMTVMVAVVVRRVRHVVLRSQRFIASGRPQVNPPLVALEPVRPDHLGAGERQPPGERIERPALQRVEAVRPDRGRGAQEHGFVHEVGIEERGGKHRPGLDHEPRDAARGELPQHGRKVEAAAGRRRPQDLGALLTQRLFALP
jgi:hypothetical protein